MEPSKNNRGSISWLLKMALRDGRASSKKLILFMASIVLGIAAVVSIQSFSSNLKANIAQQSKALMGADFIIDSDKPINQRVTNIIDSLGGAHAKEISFASMAAFPGKPATKLVQVRAIEGRFPFYGEMETTPPNAARLFQKHKGALLDATVMLQLDLNKGDKIKIGNVILPILGILKSVPGSSSVFSSIAPPVIIPYSAVDETGLIQTGSRIDYQYYFVAEPGIDMEKLDRELDPVLDANEADLDTHTSTSERMGRRYENFGKFLNLVAFIALLLGCVGIASAIHIYIKEKLKSVAILKCLGASKKQSFLIFLIQIAIIGLIGGTIGTTLGQVLQQLFPLILQDFIPIDVDISISPRIVFIGIILGLLMSILFALYPLIGTLYVSPLQTLRSQQKVPARSRKAALLVLLGIFLFILLFSFWVLENWKYSLSFVAGLIITFSIIIGLAQLFMKGIKRFFPRNWGFIPRQSLLNLYRPQNQTLILVLAIGIGSFLISTLYFTKDLLLAEASIEKQADSPNMILLDIQSEQKDSVIRTIESRDLTVLENIPIVTMRVQSIRGRSADEIRKDTTSRINGWILNHEFRTTYRDSLISSEELKQGKWISKKPGEGLVPISVSDNFAEDAKVSLGDEVSFNVQGVILNTVIGSIRAVDWSRMQLNFSIVFPTGVLEKAPQFRVLTTRVPDEAQSAGLQQELVRDYPNVTILDLRQILNLIERILTKISWLINFMAFFSILTGIIVLIGAVRTSKYQRMRESVLLRTMGAQSGQIFQILALEYFYLGVLGSLSGIFLSLLSSQLLAWLVFETSFTPNLFPFLVIFPGITLLVMGIGIGNSLGVIKSPPLVVLRKELR